MRPPIPPSDDPGITAIRRVLSDAEFPTTKQRLLQEAGDWEVTFPGNRDYRIKRFLAPVPKHKFHDADDLVEELRRAWWFLDPERRDKTK